VWVTIVESETVELARDLNLHKEHVAAEYVSLDTLTEARPPSIGWAIDWIICLST
jgi:hypothetical protein